MPFLTVILSYVLARVVFFYYPIQQVEGVSLLIMLISTFLITMILIKYKRTNRFKPTPKMKHLRDTDGKKRTIKK